MLLKSRIIGNVEVKGSGVGADQYRGTVGFTSIRSPPPNHGIKRALWVAISPLPELRANIRLGAYRLRELLLRGLFAVRPDRLAIEEPAKATLKGNAGWGRHTAA